MNHADCEIPTQTAPHPSHHSLKAIQADAVLAGWDLAYTQIEPGRISSSHVVTGNCRDITLMEQRINRRIEIIGVTSPDYISVVAPCGGTRLWLNGELLDSSNIMLLRGGIEMHCTDHSPGRILYMRIPVHTLSGSDLLNGSQNPALKPNAILNASLRRVMSAAIDDQKQQHEQSAMHVSLAHHVRSCLRDTDAQPARKNRIAVESTLKTITAAREYIHANLHGAISMSEVAGSSAASISKLGRLFQSELGLTPSQYVCAYRLSAARTALQNSLSSEGAQVSTIAMDCGFTHLGRFSQAYRNQFGVSPSETLGAA